MKSFFGIVLSTFAAFLFVPAPLGAAGHAGINIVASDWRFAPGTIIVHLNQPATLRLTTREGVHGLASPELGIPSTMIIPNGQVVLTFTPKKLGTYVVHCSIMCGAGHPNMKLVVKVVR